MAEIENILNGVADKESAIESFVKTGSGNFVLRWTNEGMRMRDHDKFAVISSVMGQVGTPDGYSAQVSMSKKVQTKSGYSVKIGGEFHALTESNTYMKNGEDYVQRSLWVSNPTIFVNSAASSTASAGNAELLKAVQVLTEKMAIMEQQNSALQQQINKYETPPEQV